MLKTWVGVLIIHSALCGLTSELLNAESTAVSLTIEHLTNPSSAFRKNDRPWILAESFLEAGMSKPVEALYQDLRLPAQAEAARRLESLFHLYSGDYAAAHEALAPLPDKDSWTVSRRFYLQGLRNASEGFVETASDHFRVRTAAEDAFLAPYVIRALENTYSKMNEVFQITATTSVVVEVYPSEGKFSLASTLSPETLERSGAIGICKFRRLMILSPRATPLGYRWLDALAHEYNHYLINQLSGTLCPLWLHEGVARYYESAWRRAGPFEHSPAAETKLAEAAAVEPSTAPVSAEVAESPQAEGSDGKLIPFKRMEPSMVYLDNQDQVALAFAEVSDAVGHLITEFGAEKLTELLNAFRRLPREQAFEKSLGVTEEDFEASWRDSLKDRAWRISQGAMVQEIRLGQVDETELVGPSSRDHVRLGDRLRQQGQAAAALLQYKKALEKEPDNGVALVKAARAHLAADDEDAAEAALRRAAEKNTSYITPYVLLGELLFDQGRLEESQPVLQEALEINPYDPRIHKYLGLIALDIGHFPTARQSLETALALDPSDEDLRRAIRSMPRDK